MMTRAWDRTQSRYLNPGSRLGTQQFAGDQFNRLWPGH
jgi:hypothetical protein